MSSPADVLIMGYGWVGAVVANQLADQGLSVTVLERGRDLHARSCGHVHPLGDERLDRSRTQRVSRETFTLRHDQREAALPLRRLGSFLSGEGVGGSGVLWGGGARRFSPGAFTPRSGLSPRAEAAAAPWLDAVDWPVDYADLEPDYARAEALLGVSGSSDGGPHEGFRSTPFPVGDLPDSPPLALYRRGALALGMHPHSMPSAELVEGYTNPLGVRREPCEAYGSTLATPLNTVHPHSLEGGRVRLITEASVRRVLHDGARALGVRYTDAGGEHELRAAVVVLAGWTLHNTRMLLLSGIGEPYDPQTGTGQVGRRYANHVAIPATGFFADRIHGRDPVHAGLGFSDLDPATPGSDFVGGGFHLAHQSANPSPSVGSRLPSSAPTWGAGWKAAIKEEFGRSLQIGTIGEVSPSRHRFLDLDPRYTDVWGDPLLRITFDWNDNDRLLIAHHGRVSERLLRAAGATSTERRTHDGPYDTVTYQNSHATGGATMGGDPADSVVDSSMRSWDLENLWVVGASAMPSSSAPPPTLTVVALALQAARAVLRYLDGSPKRGFARADLTSTTHDTPNRPTHHQPQEQGQP